jgi:hypothetical protein
MKDRREQVTATVAAATVAAAVTDAVAAEGWEVGDCHDLLHRPFSRPCWGLPGGPARHLSLWWAYHGSAGLRRRSACRFGRHRYLPYWNGTGNNEKPPDGLLCLDCGQL